MLRELRLTLGQLRFLEQLHPLVGREVVTFENIFPLVSMGLVKVCPPALGTRMRVAGRETYKLTEKGVTLLERLRRPEGFARTESPGGWGDTTSRHDSA